MIQTSDFTGKWRVSQKSNGNLSEYITRYEDGLFVELMGSELATEFLDDPDAEIWDDFKEIGYGLTSLIVGFVYFEFVRDLPYQVTNQGVVYTLEENGGLVIPALMLRQRYNENVNDWKLFQDYLKENFENFDGKKRKYITD
jgi:hypothetical protein